MSTADSSTRTEVPTLAQITIGATRSTSMRPAVTMLIEMKVMALLLWVRAPDSRPRRAADGVLRVARSDQPAEPAARELLEIAADELDADEEEAEAGEDVDEDFHPSPALDVRQDVRIARIAMKAPTRSTSRPMASDT